MVTAYLMFKTGVGIPSVTTNKGVLLQPVVAIADLELSGGDTSLTTLFPEANKRWRLLVPVTKNCDRACAQHLYITRQVHIRLAEKAYRVERVLLLLDELTPVELDSLRREHPQTRILSAQRPQLEDWLSEVQLPESALEYFYLVDQEGFAMMRYGIDHKGQDLLDDLKKLLKYTYDK